MNTFGTCFSLLLKFECFLHELAQMRDLGGELLTTVGTRSAINFGSAVLNDCEVVDFKTVKIRKTIFAGNFKAKN